jgi:thiol:disulfide interchange protein
MAFGTIQSSPWFNAVVAIIFAALALSLSGAFAIDFSKWRPKPGSAFFMGIVSALLAGACVAPVVASVLLLSADLFARGHRAALALPLFVGIGMALPWPFLGAGMKLLPKPGAWMKWVNLAFAIVVAGFAVWYGFLAWRGFGGTDGTTKTDTGAIEATPETFIAALDAAKRPVLVDCWASWCKNCAAMDRVMAEDPVRRELERFTVIRLRAEDIGALRKLPAFSKVQGLPAFAIFQ